MRLGREQPCGKWAGYVIRLRERKRLSKQDYCIRLGAETAYMIKHLMIYMRICYESVNFDRHASGCEREYQACTCSFAFGADVMGSAWLLKRDVSTTLTQYRRGGALVSWMEQPRTAVPWVVICCRRRKESTRRARPFAGLTFVAHTSWPWT